MQNKLKKREEKMSNKLSKKKALECKKKVPAPKNVDPFTKSLEKLNSIKGRELKAKSKRSRKYDASEHESSSSSSE